MEAAAEGKLSYDEVLRQLEEKAKEKNCKRWLQSAHADRDHPGAHLRRLTRRYRRIAGDHGFSGFVAHRAGRAGELMARKIQRKIERSPEEAAASTKCANATRE
jgi:hypothetical protein